MSTLQEGLSKENILIIDDSRDNLRLLSGILIEQGVLLEDVREGPADIDQLVAAISSLDRDDEQLWTKSGAPATGALEEVLGSAVSAADRDAAWKAYQESTRCAATRPLTTSASRSARLN